MQMLLRLIFRAISGTGVARVTCLAIGKYWEVVREHLDVSRGQGNNNKQRKSNAMANGERAV